MIEKNWDPQAAQLNQTIQKANSSVFEMLSSRGKSIFFPKLGILSQSADARGKAINATIGTALEDDGKPMCLPSLSRQIQLPTPAVFPYAPSPGNPNLRVKWAEMMAEKNPGLRNKTVSQPIVTCALTHGLSMAGYLFADEGDVLVTPDLYWENYDLIFQNAYGCKLATFETFTSAGGFHTEALAEAMYSQKSNKVLVSLNFPNNPTGYTLREEEVKPLVNALIQAAEGGKKLVVLIDDAYFGLVFEEGVYQESLFSLLCDAHPNLLAVKVDGATKEDYVWGFRVGFMTFGVKGGTKELYDALEAKTGGAIRGNISNASQPTQSMLLSAYQAQSYVEEKREKHATLRVRFHKVKEILAAHPEYAGEFEALPFNSGYFMCVRVKRHDAEAVRQKLLADFDTGVIAFGKVIRLAFSSTPTQDLEKLFENIHQACKSL